MTDPSMTDVALRHTFIAAVEVMAGLFTGFLERLGGLAEDVLEVYGADGTEDRALIESDLGVVRDRAEAWLVGDDAPLGYGYVAAPGVVEGHERCMVWFQRTPHGVRRLNLNFDPSDIDVYDYLDMEWFTMARDRRTPVVFGPYFDYSGSDRYVLTLSVPVLAGDRFLGVAGADVLAAGLEAAVLPALRRVPAQTVLVDAERRVVFSNNARWIQGDRMPRHPLADPAGFTWVEEVLPDVGWALACQAERPL